LCKILPQSTLQLGCNSAVNSTYEDVDDDYNININKYKLKAIESDDTDGQ